MKQKGETQSEHELLKDALRKKAFGYRTEEIVEEYGEVDGSLQLVKRKVTTKDVAPDLSALKAYQELEGESVYGKMTLSELEAERERLLKELAELPQKEQK